MAVAGEKIQEAAMENAGEISKAARKYRVALESGIIYQLFQSARARQSIAARDSLLPSPRLSLGLAAMIGARAPVELIVDPSRLPTRAFFYLFVFFCPAAAGASWRCAFSGLVIDMRLRGAELVRRLAGLSTLRAIGRVLYALCSREK